MPENCAAIVIAAKHHELIKVKDTRGTTNTVGALRCKFQFRTEDWLHSAKTAMFCNGDVVLHPEVIDSAIAVPLDIDNECAVPYEVLTDTLPYSIGVWGVTDSGLRVVSNWLVFNAQAGCYTEGNAPSDPEQTVYDEIRLISQEAINVANAVTQRANDGEFNGKTAYDIACDEGFKGSQPEWIASLKGDKGAGITDIVKIATENNIDTYQIKYAEDGTATFKITNGIDGVSISNALLNTSGELVLSMTSGKVINLGKVIGKDGDDGKNGLDGKDGINGKDGLDGKAPILKVENGNLYTRYDEKESWALLGNIQGADGKDGTDGKDGYTPKKGIDYNTEADKVELLSEVERTITGDIDAALDAILDLQNSLIGGDK